MSRTLRRTTSNLSDKGVDALSRFGRAALALGMAGSALAVGTVHTITLSVVTACLASAAFATWWNAPPTRMRPAATVLLITCVALLAYTVLQCLPMPLGWVLAVAPNNADVWSRALFPLREPPPAWISLSLDPIATRIEAVKGAVYALTFVAALCVARRREGVSFLASVIVVTSLALAIAAVLHPAFGVRRLFGLYEPSGSIPDRHVAPLMNPNHLAAYLNVGFCFAVAVALASAPRIPRAIVAAIAILLAAVQVWVASRGGVITMLLGATFVWILTRAGSSKHQHRGFRTSLLAAVTAAVGCLLMALSSEDAAGELLSADVSKLELFAQAMRMVRAYPLFGVGRGSFESTFPHFRSAFLHSTPPAWHVTFSNPENFVAQWTTEWGLPVSLFAMIAIAWALRPNAALARSGHAVGAWAALACVAVQNVADFNAEVPGVMIALVTCAAIVVAGSSGKTTAWKVEKWPTAPGVVAIVAAVLGLAALYVSVQSRDVDLLADERHLFDVAVRDPKGTQEVEALARSAMMRHPAEPYLPFIVGVREARERPRDAVVWLGAALERANIYGPAHLVLAHVLERRSPSQARMEYRLAMEQAPELANVVTTQAPFLIAGYWDARELVPTGQESNRVLSELSGSIADRLPATSARLDLDLLSQAPTELGALSRQAEGAIDDVEAGPSAPWCEGDARRGCLEQALAKARDLRRSEPNRCVGHELCARATVAAGDAVAALTEMEAAVDDVADRVPCLQRLAVLATALHDDRRAETAVNKIESAGCSEDVECSRNLRWAAILEEQRGNLMKALALYRRALERTPERDDLLEDAARLEAATGLHVEAAQDYERLLRKHPEEPRWRQAVDHEKDAALKDAIRR